VHVLDVCIEVACEEVLPDGHDVHLSPPIVPDLGEVFLKDYSLFPDNIADVCFSDV
jgi:hypothetical protein